MEAGEQFVAICAKPNLNRDFVPLPISDAAASQPTRLEQPQPDHAVGYIRNDIADAAQVEAPFTETEEVVFRKLAVSTDLHFPFLSCQWKS
ncbi:hypothetical protein E2P81_ATG10063 [Venturia nashicola]|nr:hypothetical protein E2P81_ATG10063 [Venturia nashicola]